MIQSITDDIRLKNVDFILLRIGGYNKLNAFTSVKEIIEQELILFLNGNTIDSCSTKAFDYVSV